MPERIKNAREKVVGTKQTLKALDKGEALLVYVAKDADSKIIQPVLALCEAKGVEVKPVDSMADLGSMCGIKVGAAAAAITEF
ncbi:MAG TPA: ribosomal L7Ae/L30e/S12e/Gadd45 family protein [Bacillota bacterium]|nr:50S ribosomal protein L7Ae-like protein [Bacillota bacterium]HOB87614.1 ribosomal L7Ae/L30e/S12e/Gadd45 family protein [Bacillota bacterium]HOP68281.1 ribosomal L7Ae/L30e/S12e/Gadd45 family protein [Bacillota bacterium]HPT33948.1 ribosomal L7Ae/L30e/S12e/Gadd45 family protein [Bacillota bacterium]HPZ64732.1 ribosomal L7Ae/L30e/S12e/Gadd45 family protein [Bacillota bacterium]